MSRRRSNKADVSEKAGAVNLCQAKLVVGKYCSLLASLPDLSTLLPTPLSVLARGWVSRGLPGPFCVITSG